MMWSPWTDARVRLAALFALGAGLVALGGGLSALREDVLVPSAPRNSTPYAPSVVTHAADPRRLAALDPFAESVASPETDAAAAVPPPIVLIGTIAGGSTPSAVCRLGIQTPRILHVGDTLGGWRLSHVTPGRAVFVDAAGASHELRLSPQGN